MSSHCGFVALIGRPNVGKSTLLNALLGKKVSITCYKPQTTRHRIHGIKTQGTKQAVFVDTPGLHKNAKRKLNQVMNKSALRALFDVDIVFFVVEALQWQKDDELVLEQLNKIETPVILLVNKVDTIKDKAALLPYLQMLSEKYAFKEIIPLSAKKDKSMAKIEKCVFNLLPEHPHFYADDTLTDRPQTFLATEIVREKLMRILQQELPYALTVEIEKWEKNDKGVLEIYAVIWVERDSQKGIVVGKHGMTLKRVGTLARQDMEALFDGKVFLKIWVRVKENWSDDQSAIQQFGYE